MITLCIPKIVINYLFSPSIRMSGKNVNVGDKKIIKVTFIKTKKQPR